MDWADLVADDPHAREYDYDQLPTPMPPWARPTPPLHEWDVANRGCCGGCPTCGSREECVYCRICLLEDYFAYEEHCFGWCLVRLDIYLASKER